MCPEWAIEPIDDGTVIRVRDFSIKSGVVTYERLAPDSNI